MEGGPLYQPLGEAAESQAGAGPSGVVKLCGRDPAAAIIQCTEYADFLGLEHLAENLYKKGKGAVHAFKKWVRGNAHAIRGALCDITGWGSGLLVGAGATALTDGNWLFGGTAGYIVGKGVENACNHQ